MGGQSMVAVAAQLTTGRVVSALDTSALNVPVPGKFTVGIGPVAMPPTNGPLQAKSSGSPAGSLEPVNEQLKIQLFSRK